VKPVSGVKSEAYQWCEQLLESHHSGTVMRTHVGLRINVLCEGAGSFITTFTYNMQLFTSNILLRYTIRYWFSFNECIFQVSFLNHMCLALITVCCNCQSWTAGYSDKLRLSKAGMPHIGTYFNNLGMSAAGYPNLCFKDIATVT